MSRKRSQWFVDMGEMSEELRKAQKLGRVTDHLAELFLRIAQGFTHGPRFVRYSEEMREDLVSAAVERMMKYWKRMNPESNVVSYCISCANSTSMSYLSAYYEHENLKRDMEQQALSEFRDKFPQCQRWTQTDQDLLEGWDGPFAASTKWRVD